MDSWGIASHARGFAAAAAATAIPSKRIPEPHGLPKLADECSSCTEKRARERLEMIIAAAFYFSRRVSIHWMRDRGRTHNLHTDEAVFYFR